jgi:site-specific recombinase XerD
VCRAKRRGQKPPDRRRKRIPKGPLIPYIEQWMEAGHFSETTGRLYLNHTLRWAAWCEENNIDPFNASPTDFSDWASSLTDGKEAKPDTIKSRMGTIRSLYGFLQNSNVTTTYPI